jgi:hypothetical protein
MYTSFSARTRFCGNPNCRQKHLSVHRIYSLGTNLTKPKRDKRQSYYGTRPHYAPWLPWIEWPRTSGGGRLLLFVLELY